jgi:hypothetical protein
MMQMMRKPSETGKQHHERERGLGEVGVEGGGRERERKRRERERDKEIERESSAHGSLRHSPRRSPQHPAVARLVSASRGCTRPADVPKSQTASRVRGSCAAGLHVAH